MDNAGFSDKSSQVSSPVGDIPEAFRETVPTPDAPRPRFKWNSRWAWGVLGLAIVLILGAALNQVPQAKSSTTTAETGFNLAISQAQQSLAQSDVVVQIAPNPDGLLGHFPYDEAPAQDLMPIVADGSIRLRRAAAQQYLQMANAARRDGVILVPISGFRSIGDQEYLFFDVKAQNGEQATQRAEVSAPPGYSEHHTGYAIDIGDGSIAETNLQVNFETTPAYRWLQRNAAYYSFELSFPKHNLQGIHYEPWHWRFVGDRNSLETFYKARTATRR